MKGRKPKPSLIKLLDGNPGKRPVNDREPPLLEGAPEPPEWLDAEAQAEWGRVTADLISMGLLSRADRPALAAYCTAWSRWVEAEAMVKKYGAIVKSPEKGFPMKSPYLSIAELHAQKNRELWDTLRYAGASRRQPLNLAVTTAGFDRLSICWEQHQYAEQVIEGLIHDSAFFAYISAAEPDDDWTDPEVWKKANPSFGITVNADQFAEDCKEAQESPAKENSFRRYRLNQWTEQDVRWLNMEKWDACSGLSAELDGRDCCGGLDLSSTTDLSALVLVFPGEDGFIDVLAWFWVPEEGANRRAKRDRVPYTQWIRDEYIEATPGEAIDYDRIRAKINELGKQYRIGSIAIDRWNATQLATQLEGDGFEIVAFGQGYASMTWPTKKLEALVLSERLRHGGNPVLRWMAGNVSIEKDAADNWKPSKKKSRERIDGIVALIMGLERATTWQESVYNTRGPLFFYLDDDGWKCDDD